MTREEFWRWSSRFPEALMLISSDGNITGCNPALCTLYAIGGDSLVGRSIFEFAQSSEESVRVSLRLWAGTGQMIFGPLAIAFTAGEMLRCEGAALSPAREGRPAVLLVRVRRHAATAERFLGLNATIAQLSAEIHARKRSEAVISEQHEALLAGERRFRDVLEERVSERTAKLQLALADLEAFSYTISHDLRAPLRAIQSYSEVLVDDFSEGMEEGAKKVLSRIVRAGAHLNRLTEDVLAYSRISKADTARTPIALSSWLPELIEQYPNFSSPHVEIVVASDLPVVLGNEALLTQCFANLIGNAIKFGPRDRRTEIRIGSTAGEHSVQVWVQDNGIGIDPADFKRIFGMFERVHPADQYEGTGIGLSIVRRAAEKMGATVGLSSQVGVGSRFSIEFTALG